MTRLRLLSFVAATLPLLFISFDMQAQEAAPAVKAQAAASVLRASNTPATATRNLPPATLLAYAFLASSGTTLPQNNGR